MTRREFAEKLSEASGRNITVWDVKLATNTPYPPSLTDEFIEEIVNQWEREDPDIEGDPYGFLFNMSESDSEWHRLNRWSSPYA